MKVVGSVIARLGSKRLTYKNLLPYKGVPLVLHAITKLTDSKLFDQVVLSTDSELIARTCLLNKVEVLFRPDSLSTDDIPSIPVFQHIIENFPCDIHLNYNCNFPECDQTVFEKAIEIANESGESLSNPYAVWAQTKECLDNYGDPFQITASQFVTKSVHPLDIHTMDDLLEVHRVNQPTFSWLEQKKKLKFK
jgi:CMP-2-keto-3-deoxyoctulosonic acid synthetase